MNKMNEEYKFYRRIYTEGAICHFERQRMIWKEIQGDTRMQKSLLKSDLPLACPLTSEKERPNDHFDPFLNQSLLNGKLMNTDFWTMNLGSLKFISPRMVTIESVPDLYIMKTSFLACYRLTILKKPNQKFISKSDLENLDEHRSTRTH